MNPAEFVAKYQNNDLLSTTYPFTLLSDVAWAELRHAHGASHDVPALLTAVCSPIPDDRHFALQLLHETIWHQGTVYEATAFVVPFLTAVLRATAAPEPKLLVFLLTSLITGTSDNNVWVQNIHTEVEQAIDILCLYLDDPEIRGYIATALSFYPNHKSNIIPRLEQALKDEADLFTREDIDVSLYKLRQS